MERRERGNPEWFTSNGESSGMSSSSSRQNIWNPPAAMPENRSPSYSSSFSWVGNPPQQRLPTTLPESRPFQPFRPENNNLYAPFSFGRENVSSLTVNPNPFIEDDFSALNLSTPIRQSPVYGGSPAVGYGGGSIQGTNVNSALGYGGGSIQGNNVNSALGYCGGSIQGNNVNSAFGSSSIGMGYSRLPYPPAPENSYLQRLRVQSAVRGQMGLCVQPQLDHNSEAFQIHSNSLYPNSVNNNGGPSGFPATNRIPSIVFRPPANPDSFQLVPKASNNSTRNGFRLETNSRCRLKSRNNRFKADNSSVSSSLYSNDLYPTGRRSSFSSLDELRGKIHLVARDQSGCRFLQGKFETGSPEEVDLIFSEIKDHVPELMLDQFGNYLIQKLFDVCSPDQITQILLLLIGDENQLINICTDTYGTRAMQKLLECVKTPGQRSLISSVLGRNGLLLCKNLNGHHVVEHCLKYFSREDNKLLIEIVADNCLDVATDKSGCCVLQQCLPNAEGETLERMMAEIIANAVFLSEHPYGNYVVQYMLAMKFPEAIEEILAQLAGNYVSISMNKYGSNVVERCLRDLEYDQVAQIIEEIIHSPNFLMVLQDPFGNYVAQRTYVTSKGALRSTVVNLIQIHYPFLHSHPYGKRVLAVIRGRKNRV
ncbi:putative pumilio homolog 8, chloroplastic [Diospyros lotus]|uniref:putative pumilio homolog 8, chloroplastic n=1 Tax=Diospyros lotus TaxID=55363 RepID=UPI00225AABE2|nr:putative pumilio homolog 8, chloroplastic [Diospyros lotus]